VVTTPQGTPRCGPRDLSLGAVVRVRRPLVGHVHFCTQCRSVTRPSGATTSVANRKGVDRSQRLVVTFSVEDWRLGITVNGRSLQRRVQLIDRVAGAADAKDDEDQRPDEVMIRRPLKSEVIDERGPPERMIQVEGLQNDGGTQAERRAATDQHEQPPRLSPAGPEPSHLPHLFSHMTMVGTLHLQMRWRFPRHPIIAPNGPRRTEQAFNRHKLKTRLQPWQAWRRRE
jgi:hypothetical protein